MRRLAKIHEVENELTIKALKEEIAQLKQGIIEADPTKNPSTDAQHQLLKDEHTKLKQTHETIKQANDNLHEKIKDMRQEINDLTFLSEQQAKDNKKLQKDLDTAAATVKKELDKETVTQKAEISRLKRALKFVTEELKKADPGVKLPDFNGKNNKKDA